MGSRAYSPFEVFPLDSTQQLNSGVVGGTRDELQGEGL